MKKSALVSMVILISVSILVILKCDWIADWLYQLGFSIEERYMERELTTLKLYVMVLPGILLVASLTILGYQRIWFNRCGKSFFGNTAVCRFFQIDRTSHHPWEFYISSCLAGVLLLSYELGRLGIFIKLYREDGFFEWMTVLFFMVSVLFMVITLIFVNQRSAFSRKERRTVRLLLISLIFVALWAAGEEISWGQRIFNWNTPNDVFYLNYQNETNLHNFISPLFVLIYPALGTGFFLMLLIGWLPDRQRQSRVYRFNFPHPHLFVLSLAIMMTSFKGHSDVFEELVSLFFVFYSLQLLRCFKTGIQI